jgi:hypothetical protein
MADWDAGRAPKKMYPYQVMGHYTRGGSSEMLAHNHSQ